MLKQFKDVIQDKWSASFVHHDDQKVFNDGKTGAYVCEIDIKCRRDDQSPFDGAAVLKIAKLTAEEADIELQSHRESIVRSRILQQRIPKIVNHLYHDGHFLLLQEVAAHGTQFIRSFARSTLPDRLRGFQHISDELLSDWSSASGDNASASLSDILHTALGSDRLRPDSRIGQWLQTRLGDASVNNIVYDEAVYPTVAGLLQSPEGRKPCLRPLASAMHGDFHGANILLEKGLRHLANASDDPGYYIIDFSFFKTDGLAFFDIAYLEHSLLIDGTRQRPLTDCVRLANRIGATESNQGIETDDDHIPLRHAVAIFQAVDLWIKTKHPARRSDLIGQFKLARAAAAFNFANKRVDDAQREKSFLISCVFLKYAFAHFGIKSDGSVARWSALPPKVASSPSHTWSTLFSLDSSRSFVVHCMGPEWNKVASDDLTAFNGLPPDLVVEFDADASGANATDRLKAEWEKLRPITALAPNERSTSALPSTHSVICYPLGRAVAGLDFRNSTPLELRRATEPMWSRVREFIGATLAGRELLIVISGFAGPLDLSAQRAWAALASAAPTSSNRTVVVSTVLQGDAISVLGPDAEGLMEFAILELSPQELCYHVREAIGTTPGKVPVEVPCRPTIGDDRRFVEISQSEFAAYSSAFELVHRNAHDGDDLNAGTSIWGAATDFLMGAEPTWYDLQVRADLKRDVYPQLRQDVKNHLDNGRTGSALIQHAPGAGGTTVGRRLAWDLHLEFPCVIVRNYHEHLDARLSDLYKRSNNLPILIVVERSGMSTAQRETLFRNLRVQHVRFYMIEIERNARPSGRYCLPRAMPPAEAKRFSVAYGSALRSIVSSRTLLTKSAQDAESFSARVQSRLQVLDQLATHPAFENFRSPFFFGFFAFETEHKRVSDFIRECVAGITPTSRIGVERAAVCAKYTDRFIPEHILRAMFSLDVSGPKLLSSYAPEAVARLFVGGVGTGYKIVHPAIAEEVLKQYALREKSGRLNLPELYSRTALGIIDVIEEKKLQTDAGASQLCMDLFIKREFWEDEGKTRKNFSELLGVIGSRSQKEVILNRLVEVFPDGAHFWHHLGRLRNIELNSSLDVTAQCFLRAIELDDADPYHWHGLGMVYKGHVKRKLGRLGASTSVDDAILEIRPSIDAAAYNFAEARNRDKEEKSEHPLVSEVQLYQLVLQRLFERSGASNWIDFLASRAPWGDWVRGVASQSDELMRRLSARYELRKPSPFYVKLLSVEDELLGDHGGALERLRAASKDNSGDQFFFSRQVAHFLHRQYKFSFSKMRPTQVAEVASLLRKNYEHAPERFSDFKLWLLAARHMPDFSLTDAEQMISAWRMRDDSAESYMYAYILEFHKYEIARTDDVRQLKVLIEECRHRAPRLERKHSFEWYATTPQNFPFVHHAELGEWNEDVNFYNAEQKTKSGCKSLWVM